MSKREIIKRYLIFLVGLFISSLGVSFITKVDLGTSPISSIPYVLSLGFKPTLGQYTIFFSLLLIILQFIILGKSFKKESLLQIPVSILFGYFIDWSMLILWWLNPENYGLKMLSLLVGCIILALGVYFEVIANVVMLPGESFVKAVTYRFNTDFGITKVCFDASMTIAACLISFVLFNKINGVREGTVIAAFIVGLIAKFFGKTLARLTDFLLPRDNSINDGINVNGENKESFAITIAREYGSGGREIGKKIADKLGIAYYDSELISIVAKESGYSEEFVSQNEQKISNNLFYDLYAQYYAYTNDDEPKYDILFKTEQKIIRELAEKSSCVIVGRMSNYALRENKRAFNVFVSADINSKVKHITERDGLTEQEAIKKIVKVESERRKHCRHFTDTEWGMASNYDMTIKTSKYSVEEVADIIINMAQRSIGFSDAD